MALDAWHEPFRIGEHSSAIFVELSFREGRVGGDDGQIPFTFKLSLKKALLTIKLEEPLQIDRRTIARSIPDTQVEHSKIKVAKGLAEASLVGKAKISPAALHVALTGSGKMENSVSHEDQVRLIQTIPETLVTPRPEGNRSYAWELEPSFHPTLRGQPWDPVEAPRLRARVNGAIGAIAPSVVVEVTCALEDLEISDLVPKKPSINQSIRNIVHNEISEAAAIQHLKMVLRDADLEPGSLDNRFADLIVANVLALPE